MNNEQINANSWPYYLPLKSIILSLIFSSLFHWTFMIERKIICSFVRALIFRSMALWLIGFTCCCPVQSIRFSEMAVNHRFDWSKTGPHLKLNQMKNEWANRIWMNMLKNGRGKMPHETKHISHLSQSINLNSKYTENSKNEMEFILIYLFNSKIRNKIDDALIHFIHKNELKRQQRRAHISHSQLKMMMKINSRWSFPFAFNLNWLFVLIFPLLHSSVCVFEISVDASKMVRSAVIRSRQHPTSARTSESKSRENSIWEIWQYLSKLEQRSASPLSERERTYTAWLCCWWLKRVIAFSRWKLKIVSNRIGKHLNENRHESHEDELKSTADAESICRAWARIHFTSNRQNVH